MRYRLITRKLFTCNGVTHVSHVTGISLSNFPISRHVQYKVKVTREDVGRHLHTRVSRLRTDDVTAARGRVSSLLSLPVQVLQNLRPRHEADRGWAGRSLLVSALGLRQRVSPPLICSASHFSVCRYSERLGLGYDLFQLVNSGASFTAAILFLCYSVSCIRGRTFHAVRPSLFVS